VGRGGEGLWRGGPDGGGHAWAVLWRCLGECGVCWGRWKDGASQGRTWAKA